MEIKTSKSSPDGKWAPPPVNARNIRIAGGASLALKLNDQLNQCLYSL